MNNSKVIKLLLIVSAVNLTLMIPGGFIESRDFSHISTIILGGFNIFLTTLGMVSLFLIYFINKEQKWAFKISLICGLCYLVVYTIDLLGIFPKTPSEMPLSLLILEILGIIVTIPLLYYSSLRIKTADNDEKTMLNKYIYLFIGLAILIGIGIIIFATKAAMTGK